MNPEIIAAFVGLCGIAIGATLQYLLNEHYETEKERKRNLSATYSELLLAIHNLAAKQVNGVDQKDAQERFENAKSQFIIHGSAPTIKMLSEWLARYGVLNSDEARVSFAAILQRMRCDIIQEPSVVTINDVSNILFGKKK